MKHIMKHSFSSLGSVKGGCHSSPKLANHYSSSHHKGSSFSHPKSNFSHKNHHESSYPSHHGGTHLSNHGCSSVPLYKGAHLSHHGGSHLSHHGGSHLSHHGGSHLSYHGGSHLSYHGGSHLSHHGGSYRSHHERPKQSHHGSSRAIHHGGPNLSHYGSYHSTHEGSGCKSVSFSKHAPTTHGGVHGGHSAHFSSSGSHGSWKNSGLLSINEKETMQVLNERLSSYLQKVSSLEQENAQLERKICEWYENNAPSTFPDSSQFFRIISDLQNQISATTMENARIMLQIDNARLAADDFRNKYEMELQLSNGVEADVNNLRRVLEGLNRERCELEREVQNLEEELQQMKRNHDEEVNCLRAQLGARVNVELNAAPSIDLNGALSEIRDEYENLMERNLREVENMFLQRSEELNRQVMSGAQQLQSVQTEAIELRRTVQTLEIELQSQLSMTSALESTLAETQSTYGSKLAQIQGMIDNVESQLAQIRSDLERQNYEYKVLMDQKTHLEMEIATYKRLLDGHDIQLSGHHASSGNHGSPEHGQHETKC
ncbi:keratin, type I cytoskeletal 42-like [Spea bombifrons]|uniref:keratin, type I cytoskeletal 42-like n=1 Tax=Spea bombifrons TaxID=233779 RepID=UPI00234A7F97|nr:keratin, type I cytoskeletal 42-like [Spea bombifrons]